MKLFLHNMPIQAPTHIRTYTRIHHCIDVVKLIYAYTSDSRAATVTSALKQGQRVHHFDLQPEPSSQLNPQHCTNNNTLLEVCIWDCDPVRLVFDSDASWSGSDMKLMGQRVSCSLDVP